VCVANLLGQLWVLHEVDDDSDRDLDPEVLRHCRPPYWGVGLLQLLVLVLVPLPHVTVHVPYAPHVLHVPLTANSDEQCA
jgi:hypothetical protein